MVNETDGRGEEPMDVDEYPGNRKRGLEDMGEVMDREESQESEMSNKDVRNVEEVEVENTSSEEPGSRLIITKMVLENFKSYAGRIVIGPFHESFSAIVGPNGSGKSNVIDAMLFVFGYRASKIRQGKLKDLIHSSSDNERCSQCTVEVHFEEKIDKKDGKGSRKLEGSELVISRAAYYNGSSKYFINGTASNFTEVTALLREKGVDLDHKRFLILQGEVESIALMKPKATKEGEEGLLEYLEDIIGTAHYKEKIEATHKIVDEMNETRTEKIRRVKIVERELEGMEGKKKEALQYIMLENEATMKKNELFQYNLYENNKKMDKLIAKRKEVLNKLEKENAETAQLKVEIDESQKEYKKLVNEQNKLEGSVSELEKEHKRVEKEEVKLAETQKHLNSRLKKTEKKEDELRTQVRTAQETIRHVEVDVEKRNKEMERLEGELEQERKELEKITGQLKGKTQEYTEKVQQKQKVLEPWREKLNQEQSQLEVIQTEIRLIEDKKISKEKVVNAEEEVMEKRKLRAIKDKEMNEKVEEFGELEEEIDAGKRQVEELDWQVEDLEKKLKVARASEEEAKSALVSEQAQGVVLKALLKERDLGRIKGIYGRLGSLGTIEDKYDVAISTACPSLEHIVVQTVEAGEKCVEFLRSNNLGRASFYILDVLPRPDMRRLDEYRKNGEGAPLLLDLVKPQHERYIPAFYRALGGTLAADDLNQARKIAYGKERRRVVTLDGKLIDSSGTMTGGGNKINRGAMSSVPQKAYVSPQRMKDLTSERATVESEYKLNVEKKHKKQKELERQQKRYLELETLLPKLEIELRAADENVKTAKKTLNELKRPEANQLSKEDTAKVDSLRQQEEQQHRNIEKLREQCKNIEQEIRELNTKIMQAGGVALRTQTVKVDGIKEKIALINEEITSGDVKKTKAGLELARGSKELGRCKDEKERVHEELEQVNASIGNKRQLQAKLSEELKDTRIQAEEIKDQVEAFKSELDVNINKFNKIRKAGAKLQMEADDLERAETEHQRKGKYWKSSIESLVLQTLPAELEEAVDIPTTLPVFEEETLCETDEAMLEKEIEQIQAKLQTAKPNLSVLVEFAKRAKELGAHTAELDSITTQRDDAVESYTRLHKQRLDEFMAGFNAISHKLKEMYQLITLGGSAELELVDSLDPFAEGIVFSVMPPKKSWKNISDLSGGEKTLSSLALVFALHQYKPTPIYVMDEIDAALDFRNVSIVANYIKERTKDAQFIVISLRNNMFELADWLVGVYKFENKTKSLPVNPKPFQKLLSNSL